MASPAENKTPDEYFVKFDITETNKLRIYATKTTNNLLNEYQSEYDLNELKNISHFFDKYNSINEVVDDFHSMFQNNEMSITNKGQHLHLDWIKQEFQEFTGRAIMPIDLISSKNIKGENNMNSLLEENQNLLQKLRELQAINQVKDDDKRKLSEQINQLQGEEKYDDINNLLKQEIERLQKEVEELKLRNSELINKQNELLDRIKILEANSNEQKETAENNAATDNNPLRSQGQQAENQQNENNLQADNNQQPENIVQANAENVAKNSLIFVNLGDLKLIEDKINKGELKYTLLFRASKDGDTAGIFHEKCNGLPNTLIIIKTKDGKRFGGYTNQSWESNNVYKQDDSAFIFSLDKQKCYSVTEEKFAIWCFENYGPIFEGYQIDVEDNFLTTGVCQTGLEGVGFETTEDYELNDGKENFLVSEMEVYQIEF